MYFVHICYSAIIISLRKIMHVCRKEEFSYKGLEHKLTLPREKNCSFSSTVYICGVFWGLSIPHINMFIVTNCVYILFEICMFFSTQLNEIAV